MKRNLHVWCKDLEIVSNSYLSLSYKLAKKKKLEMEKLFGDIKIIEEIQLLQMNGN